jgi:hypothetical protein
VAVSTDAPWRRIRLSELPVDDPISMRYDPESTTHFVRFDDDVIAPSMAVVEAIARVDDTTPTALEPLVDTIDPAAIDRLIKRTKSDDCALEFRYIDHVVTVRSRGIIEIRPADD